MPDSTLAQRIDEWKIPFTQRKHGHVGLGALTQRPEPSWKPERVRRVGGGALDQPWIYGAISDRHGVSTALVIVAMVALAVIPLAQLLRPAIGEGVARARD